MANEPYITRKDLETVTQKVTIDNAKKIAQPLIDQQKKNDLKDLEQNIEQKVLFQDIADGVKGLGDSLISGLKSLIPKTDGGLSKLLGLGLGLLLAPFVGFISFLGQLGRELNFFTKGRAGEFLKKLKVSFKGLFSGIFDKLKNSKLGKWIGGIIDRLKNSKLFKSISGLFQKVFCAGKGGFFSRLASIFKGIVKFINVANVHSGNKTAKIEYYDSSATTYYALSGAISIAGEGYINWTDINLVLEAGDKVTITAGTASTVHATVGVELIYNPLTT